MKLFFIRIKFKSWRMENIPVVTIMLPVVFCLRVVLSILLFRAVIIVKIDITWLKIHYLFCALAKIQ